ncbi:hypothetical protein [Arthrobacter sp. MMS24-S77]
MTNEGKDSATGLHLIAAADGYAFRITKTGHHPLRPLPHESYKKRSAWSRFDTLGSTVYLAEKRECAFAELLARFKAKLGQVHPLEKDARSLGMTLAEFIEAIDQEADELQYEHSGFVPEVWCRARRIAKVCLPQDGWWVDIEHPDTIAAVESALGSELAKLKVASLTTAVLRSDRRKVTTLIAEWIKGVTLQDGSQPLGLVYASKYGYGKSWAYWMRRIDDGFPDDSVMVLEREEILPDNPDLQVVLERYRLTMGAPLHEPAAY